MNTTTPNPWRIPLAGDCTACGQPARELRIYPTARVVDHAQPGSAGLVAAVIPPCPLPNPAAADRGEYAPARRGSNTGTFRTARAA